MKDYYEILGLPANASEEDIKSRYRYLALVYHPDRFTDPKLKSQAGNDLRAINEAFSILSNPERRAGYDNLRRKEPFPYPPSDTRKETRRIDRFAIIDLVQEAKQKLGERGRLFSPTVNLKGFDLHGLDLTEIYIELGDWGARRIEFDFSNSNLQNTDLSHNTFYEPRFTGAILNGTKLIEARIYFADWEGSKIKDVDFSQSECMTIEINGRNLSGCRFYGTQISGIELIGCKLQNTVLDNCEIGAGSLVNSDLSNSSLVNSKLRDINLNYTNFNNTNMTGAYLGSVKAEGATFIDAVLSKSTITYSHLIIAKLRNAKLDQSDLSYCNLRGADLTNCDLSGANLSNTTLEGANLTGAVLRGAKNHSYARINNMTTFPDGTRKGIFNNLSKFI